MDKITKNYKVAATGLLTIADDGQIYISVEDGPQDVNLAVLLADFNNKGVKFSCNYDEEYMPKTEVNEDGEIIDL
jgi:hypothetical protein